MTWWDDYQARRGLDRKSLYVNNMKNTISTEFKNSTSYNLVKINNVDRDVRIVEESSIIKNPNKKRLLCYPDETISVGNIVLWNSENWICTETDTTSEVSDVGLISRCNNVLKFYDKNQNILYNIPCIIQNSNIKLDNDKFMFLPADEHILICSNNADSSNIDLNTRFILNDNAYSIIGIDNISNQGLLNIRIKDDQINSDDNLDLSIANYYSHQIVREIYILNGTSASLLFNNATLQLNTICKDNNVIVDNPIITYSSSNINIATVSSTGLITCKGTGDVIITAIYSGVSDTITIHGDISEVDDYNIVITPLDETLKISRSITFTAHAMKNGVEDLTREFIWEIRNLDGSSNLYASIVVDGDNGDNSRNCIVTAGNIGNIANKYVVIKCSLTSDNSVYVEREIKLINLF